MATKVQLRRDTASNWTSSNPILSAGELGFETDTGMFKIGDGSLQWNQLGYKRTLPEPITVVCPPNQMVEIPELGFDPAVVGSVRGDIQIRASQATLVGIFSAIVYGHDATIERNIFIIGGNVVGANIFNQIDEETGHVKIFLRVNNSVETTAIISGYYFTALTEVGETVCPEYNCEGCDGIVPFDCMAACEAWYNANCL